jgi:hypothetical protein
MRLRSSEQEDFLLRMIQEAAEALRRVRGMLTRSSEPTAGVRAEITAATARLLGPEAALLQQLDAETAVRLLNDRRRLDLWIEALELEAASLALEGLSNVEALRRAEALRASGAQLGL